MKILRTSDKNRQSYNGFQWPESGFVEAPDWDPTPECGGGLHGLAEGEGDLPLLDRGADATWQVVEIYDSEFVDLDGKVKFPKGDVIYSGSLEGALGILAGELSIREWVCKDPQWAYLYAIHVDKSPRDDTRTAACQDPQWAYFYALCVDECPRDDTREAACQSPRWAHQYALKVDMCPREDTRSAACQNPRWASRYTEWESTK